MKKKGFTLIELLAVIVILAIIALILVPKISDLIFNVRRQAFRGTVNGIIDSADGYKTEFSFNHITGDMNYPVTFECDGTACKNSSNETLSFKGKAPTSGKVIINKDGILAENLTDGTFCGNGYKWDLRITVGCDGVDNEVTLAAGLYDDDDNLVADWNTLVNTYNFNISKDYSDYNQSEPEADGDSLYYIMENNNELSSGSKLVISPTVAYIGEYAVSMVNQLKNVIISNSVTSIGDYAFYYNNYLENITFGSNIQTIGNSSFAGNSELQEIILNDGLVSIGEFSFAECGTLRELIIPDSVTTLGAYAFDYDEFERITIGDGIVGDFPNYAGLYPSFTTTKYIKLGNGITNISGPDYSFNGLESLETIILGNGIVTIDEGKFAGSDRLTTVVLSNDVTSIGEGAFRDCPSLTSITLPDSLETIGDEAFYGTGLTSIVIPNSVTYIGNSAFRGNDWGGECNLASVTFGNSVETIGDEAFYGCTNITQFEIPSSLRRIGEHAFYNTGLTSLYVPATLTNGIGWEAFGNCPYLETIVLDTTSYIYSDSFDSSHVKNLTIRNGYVADYNGYSELVNLTIGSGVTRIDDDSFKNCPKLRNVTLNEGLTYIGTYVFSDDNSIQTLTIPNSVTSLSSYICDRCSGLTTINIGNGVTELQEYTFSNLSNLRNVTIGNGLERIWNYAFSDVSSIENVTLGNNVNYIDYSSFGNPSHLTSLTFTNTSRNWYYEDNDYNEIEFSVANPSNNAALFKQTYEISRDWQRR